MESKIKATQMAVFYDYLKTRVETASMVSRETGIPQKNICRYKRRYQEQGKLAEIRKGICKVTGYKAWYITTNAELFPATRQADLFGGIA
jgi:hypothetical protein